jgi:hypothetical protein
LTAEGLKTDPVTRFLRKLRRRITFKKGRNNERQNEEEDS